MKITNQWLVDNNACLSGKERAFNIIGDGMELSELLPKFDRADWLLWTLKRTMNLTKVQYVELAVLCAGTVLKIYESKYPQDKRPRNAIKAAMNYVLNPTEANRVAAHAADAAAHAAYAAAHAAGAAADAVHAADVRTEHHKKLVKLILSKLKKWGIK